MKLKVCGMKYNPGEVAALQPDYLGFIFWEPSARNFVGEIPELPTTIKKFGVFVDASIKTVLDKVITYDLGAVQLHGKENAGYCKAIRDNIQKEGFEIIKVFSVNEDFDFGTLKDYEDVCDYFLFDTKGKLPGGNGYTFDWSLLNDYPSKKPFFLSGGIGLESMEKLKDFLKSPASTYCHAIDVNSKFETKPGLKKTEALRAFKAQLIENRLIKTDNRS
ncbi:phosphoribosylanthranilate isomerase [Muricauda sp. 2012CJ35-5]|uniref:N-(5'-phosphoribosyl)anthranilate isomerase n=1 Tax=Flagellimonas spongiicola TaxID=2942208 RepID=A0ABT0PVD8_9FLAO|nr:phosphoribosylanthranilate isomerase [Allomuricauda spongiicola]MCL6275251.1 phosphoribosylanthranilate isomerase [Allomuricauda spongiicola]